MTSIFVAVSFIETVSGASILTSIATYRISYNEFMHYNYKAFSSANNEHMIKRIQQYNYINYWKICPRRLSIEYLKTIEEQPTVNDLPQCPPFGACTAPSCSYDAGSKAYQYSKSVRIQGNIVCSGELYKGNNMVSKQKTKVQQTKVIANENNEHSEKQNPTNENKNKTSKGNDDNTNLKSNILKSAMKKP
ncbi:4095_t:CDS:2 [Gigaspora rosea]|nr:4095_t:CDS:2 [Gigaspora rosea]